MIIEINTQCPLALYEQLRDQVVLGIASMKLVSGESLPSVRALAADLGINFHTVNKAYAMLCDEGYIVMDRRKGAIIAPITQGSEAFLTKITQNLTLTAAEVICHNISKDAFIALCTKCYQKAKGET